MNEQEIAWLEKSELRRKRDSLIRETAHAFLIQCADSGFTAGDVERLAELLVLKAKHNSIIKIV